MDPDTGYVNLDGIIDKLNLTDPRNSAIFGFTGLLVKFPKETDSLYSSF